MAKVMATNGFRANVENKNEESSMKWPLEYVTETKECICGRCGQVLLPVDHNTEQIQTHFKDCENVLGNGVLMVFEKLRKMDQKFDALNAEMKKKEHHMKAEAMEEIKAEILSVKTEIRKEMEDNKKEFNKAISGVKAEINKQKKNGEMIDSALSILFRRVKILEDGVKKKMAEVNGRVSGVTETISTVVHSILEAKGQETTPGHPVQQLENKREATEATKQMANKKIKTFHQEPSDRPTLPMDCFNLVTQNQLFEPSFRWTIEGIKALAEWKTFELTSVEFQWNGYPVRSRAKFQLKEDGYVHLSLCLNEELKGPNVFQQIPQVFYLLKGKNKKEPQHMCHSVFYLASTSFTSAVPFKLLFANKSWFNHSNYNLNDSVEIEVYVEPSPMMQQVCSHNGTLEWNIENYKKRLQLEAHWLVPCEESPIFYTGPRGYRVQVRMMLGPSRLNRSEGPMARVMFLTGQFDAEVSRSFPHSTTVMFMNRKNPVRRVSKTVVTNILDKMYYDFEICKFKELEDLVENDALFCKVIVKSLKHTI